ncbi:MAG: cell division protein SepF [Clostridia bacterium]|nr:cell division protein SepF [Clostridia bacterium]
MARLGEFFSNLMGISAEEEDEILDGDEAEYADDDNEYEAQPQQRAGKRGKSNITALPTASKQRLVIYRPVSYEDADTVVDQLKSRRPVVVNIAELMNTNLTTAQRVYDYIAGAAYALGGQLVRIDEGIYLLAPSNYSIGGDAVYKDR